MPKKTEPLFGEDVKTNRGFHKVAFTDEYGKACHILESQELPHPGEAVPANRPCHLQESSRAICQNEDGSVDDPLGWLWLGLDDPDPKIMVRDAVRLGIHTMPPGEHPVGWMPYPLPEEVLVHTAMHLNEKQVRGLIQRLQMWLDNNGYLDPR